MNQEAKTAAIKLLMLVGRPRGDSQFTVRHVAAASRVLMSLDNLYRDILMCRHTHKMQFNEIARSLRYPEWCIRHSYQPALTAYVNKLIAAHVIKDPNEPKQGAFSGGPKSTSQVSISFSCPQCNGSIKLPQTKDAITNCPMCASILRVARGSAMGLVVEILNPKILTHMADDPCGKRAKPLTLGQCYKLLEVSPDDPPEVIRNAYIKQISQYHPDKVEHLGPKLKEVAEETTKKLNRAWEMIRAYINNGTEL